MAEYIEREAAINAMCRLCSDTTREKCRIADICNHVCRLEAVPAADVLPRDEAIKMGAELAAMHGSDATSQQLEEAYLKGVEDSMTWCEYFNVDRVFGDYCSEGVTREKS